MFVMAQKSLFVAPLKSDIQPGFYSYMDAQSKVFAFNPLNLFVLLLFI